MFGTPERSRALREAAAWALLPALGALAAAGACWAPPRAPDLNIDDVLAGRITWHAGPPLLAPDPAASPRVVALKDPTVARVDGAWQVYLTRRTPGQPAHMEHVAFGDWKQAGSAARHPIRLDTTYHCAPQLLYFRPHRKWYLIYQWADSRKSGDEAFGPAFSTVEHPSRPETLTPPRMLFSQKPGNVKGWLDFWVVCDETHAYLFFTSLDGRMWRSRAPLAAFPHGWDAPRVALQADIFEASHTYRIKGRRAWVTIVEAQRGGTRYYKAYVADRLDGAWRPAADTWERPFAGAQNLAFAAGVPAWTDAVSHGELVREGNDETMTVDLSRPRLVIQGCTEADRAGKGYGDFPWRIGILEGRAAR